MTDGEADAYAVAISKLLLACGKAPRQQMVDVLATFGVAEEQAHAVLERGLARSFFLAEPGTASLRAPRQLRQDVPRMIGGQTTDPRKAQDSARRLALLDILLTTVPVVMWAIDKEGYFLYYEGKGLEHSGLQDGTFVGQNYHELFGDHVSTPYVTRALAGEVVHGFWDFSDRSWESWCFPIRDAAGEVDLIALVSFDITEAKQAEAELRGRLETIERQQRVISELSTPIIEVWDRVLALPLLGVVDSTRAAAVMTNLLAEVVHKQSAFVLLDLTGVEAVDTATASYMLDLIRAVRLLGAEGIITGIRPSVAQTMVTLGVGLEGIVTHANLRQALQHCLRGLRAGAP